MNGFKGVRGGLLLLGISAAALAGAPRAASAVVYFDYVCASLDGAGRCAADPALDFTLGFKDAVVTPNGSFTGADSGLESLSFTSGIGDGFTITLGDMAVDRASLFIMFNAAADAVLRLEDAGADTLVWFGLGASGAPGWVRFRESHINVAPPPDIFPYAINGRWDRQGVLANNSDEIAGRFVRRAAPPPPIPEPATLALFATGLLALGGLARARRERRR